MDRGTRGLRNMLLVVEDRVTDEQVRGVTERGEWDGNGKGVGWGWTESGLGMDGEWVGDRRGVGWERKGSGLGVERKWVGEWKACEGGGLFYLDVNLFCPT